MEREAGPLRRLRAPPGLAVSGLGVAVLVPGQA
jgi:hypothetical protein